MKTISAAGYLIKEIDEQRTSVIGSIVGGRLPYEEYQRLCGSLQGLEFTKTLIIELTKKAENDDE
jgi:hypothetical protein